MRRAIQTALWATILCTEWSVASCAKGEAQEASQAAGTREASVRSSA